MRPGRTELQVAAGLNAAMAELGGEEAAIRTMVSAGPDVWCRTHSPPSRRPIEVGDVMYVDACGVSNRYHVDLCRTFAVGQSFVVIEAISCAWSPRGKSQRPTDPLNSTSPTKASFDCG